ncbi:hypothetical protein CHLNCDRAFT_133573 [Chlorella variabilis]|uniref:Uncharacterized protein n=1 Tax=Chlorella variabilis TaxID=554065 RepID=E1Z3D6_CHLVA|nr:hypothetical protein CHLNCDRAFT_133573 [Chlorella variabilis]EFN60148.1 hypothetical protein CHLNCDRAFT_133573 [Chlorella variabilis]|eukprot:XP_005852250.1 hypothetical protein CHLNCDRAFT_133573 [Chlorella variabilis]
MEIVASAGGRRVTPRMVADISEGATAENLQFLLRVLEFLAAAEVVGGKHVEMMMNAVTGCKLDAPSGLANTAFNSGDYYHAHSGS